MKNTEAAIAVTRFGMGARPGEITDISGDARDWLKVQISPKNLVIGATSNLLTTDQAAAQLIALKTSQRDMKKMKADAEDIRDKKRGTYQDFNKIYAQEVALRNRHAVETGAGFAERWVRFWSNHFTVARRNRNLIPIVGAYEREAIRPHVFGRFETLLEAATFHQAMLIYLDNHNSIGPNSPLGNRRKRGLNENLAREVMELHTLGVGGGYDQADVTSFAKALTGWTVKGMGAGQGRDRSDAGKVIFNSRGHEPGAQKIMGNNYAAAGASQAKNVLQDLSKHPSTAHHIATKVARHFISDMPPASAIKTLTDSFLKSDGNLAVLAEAVIDLDEAWSSDPQKFKSPEELLISSARAFGYAAVFKRNPRRSYQALGQMPFSAASPDGWPDIASEWSGPDAIKKRLEWADQTSARLRIDVDANDFLNQALGPLVSENTHLSVKRAENREQALTLALMSPEFQRR